MLILKIKTFNFFFNEISLNWGGNITYSVYIYICFIFEGIYFCFQVFFFFLKPIMWIL